MAKKILSIVLALIMALSVFTVAASAAETEATAESFEADYAAAGNGDVIILTEDVEIYGSKQTSKDITIDLAGHTITCTATGVAGLIATSKTGNLTITDSVGGGKIDSDYAALQAQAGATVVIDGGTIAGVRAVANLSSAGNVVINDGVVNTGSDGAINLNSSYSSRKPSCTVDGGEINGDVFTVANCVLTVNDGEFTSGSYCIVGNGTKKNTEITINGGTFTATNATGAAIYHPQGGTLTINDGTFEGADALYIKSGTTTINGGTFIGTGAAAEYSYNGNGFNATGDAIVIDSCGYPNGQPPFVKINDGDFTSDEANAIGVYTYGESEPATVWVYGGTFSDDSAEAYAGPLAYNVTTETYYATVAEAVTAAVDGDVIALQADVTTDKSQSVSSKSITLDLNGYSYTSTNANTFIAGTSKKVFTIADSVGTGSVNGNLVQAQTGGSITINGGTINALTRCIGPVLGAAGVLTINNGAVINGAGDGAVEAYRSGKVVINGGEINDDVFVRAKGILEVNGGTFNAEDYCIVTNGNESGQVITINGGYFTATGKDSAVAYLPGGATVTINGGTFKGSDALYIKSGTVTINSGIFYATGAKADYKYYGNGFYSTGDTIVIDSCGYPSGAPSVTINKGAYWSKNGEMIGYYYTEGNELESTGFIYNGSFEKEVPAEYYAIGDIFQTLRVNGGTATIDEENLITITANEGSDKIEVYKNGNVGSTVSFSDLAGGAKLSSNNQLYARTAGTAKITVNGETYDAKIIFPHVDVEDLLVVTGADVSVEGSTVTLTATADQVTVSSRTTANTSVTFGARTGAAKVSSGGTLYAKADGTAVVTVPNSGTYTVVFDFEEPEFVFSTNLLKTTNATVALEGSTITVTPVNADASASIVYKLTDGTEITFSNLSGAKISSGKSLYANKDATATATINGDAYTVVFDYPEAPVVIVPLADNLRVNNATVAVEGTTITLTPVDSSVSASMYAKLKDGTAIGFSALEGAKISKNGTLYADKDATATATIGGTAYTVVFDYPTVAKDIRSILKFTGATGVLDGTTLTLTAKSGATQINLYPECWDGETVATFSNRVGCGLSKSGTLYAKKNATAKMTIDGVDYTVNFVFA